MKESSSDASSLIRVENLTVAFGAEKVVEDLSFSVRSGQTLAIVGESGSGKSVTSLSILRLADISGAHYLGGRILFESAKGEQDLLALSQQEMRAIRGTGNCHDLSGTDDLAQSCLHDRRPDCRGLATA